MQSALQKPFCLNETKKMPTLQETVEAETVEEDDAALIYIIDLFEVRRANEDDATDEHVVGTGTCGSRAVRCGCTYHVHITAGISPRR